MKNGVYELVSYMPLRKFRGWEQSRYSLEDALRATV